MHKNGSVRRKPVHQRWSVLLVVLALIIAGCGRESPRSVQINPQILETYVGRYQASPDTIVTIRHEGERLLLEIGLGSAMEFLPEGDDRFIHQASSTKISFLKDQRGGINELVLHRNGDHRAPRISGGSPDEVRSVTVGGIKYRFLLKGSGRTTVVLVSGLEKWAKVRTGIEPIARVISYEITERDSNAKQPVPGEIGEEARRLHAFLEAIQAPPPYVLVGHSYAGAQVRIFTDLFPAEVSGLVLVDPFHEGFVDWLKVHQPQNYELFRQECTEKYVSDWDGLLDHLRKAQLRPDLPVVLLTAGQRQIRMNDALEQKLEQTDFEDGAQAILSSHSQWISKVPGGKQLTVPNAGHEIPTERPGAVVEAIKELVSQREKSDR